MMRLACWLGLAVSVIPVFAQSAKSPRALLHGDYADPSILRDGDDYYLTHSSFLYAPGFLIWHSRDLVHWEPIGRALTKMVGSAMAPDLVKHDGKYFIYFPTQAGTNWVIQAESIRGPWSDPVELKVHGIDPGHAVGEDGKRYLFLNDGRRAALADNGLSVTGPVEKVYSGWEYPREWKTEGMYLESPKIFHHGDYFYMLSAEGGTAGPPTSHMVVAARSRSIHGPWENSPYNPIVHTYNADEPWWSKGHGTLVDDGRGHWWIVYHAYAKGEYPLGRQTLIEPIEWLKDGWFRLAKNASLQPASTQNMPLSDDFSGGTLGLQWTTWRDYDPTDIMLKQGSLFLRAKGSSPKDARLLLTTAMESSYETQAEVALAPGSMGGVVLFYSEKAFAGIASDGREFTVYQDATRTTRHPSRFGGHFFLKILNERGNCTVFASGDGKSWETIQSGIDVSGMHHNNFLGFFALRPGLMAAGAGEVKFNRFAYRALP
jgi:beta-xylosidase